MEEAHGWRLTIFNCEYTGHETAYVTKYYLQNDNAINASKILLASMLEKVYWKQVENTKEIKEKYHELTKDISPDEDIEIDMRFNVDGGKIRIELLPITYEDLLG